MERDRHPNKRISLAGMHVDRTSTVPLHLQIAGHIRSHILSGVFPAGIQFLGSREIARELGCSRTVVLTAWDLLYAEGYLESTPRGHVMVAKVATAYAQPASAASSGRTPSPGPAQMSERWRSLLGLDYETNWPSVFAPGAPDISTFPFREWSRLLRQSWQNPKEQECLDLPSEGHPRLRSEIANFLGSVRGLVCSPEEVVVTSGTSGALDFCSRMILDPGDEVWVEEPGFIEARWALTAAGARLVPVPVDDKGLVVSEGIRRAPRAKLIVVTPSHQYPLGGVMPIGRRHQLLAWARKNDAYVIEDDYDSEYRYDTKPIPPLHALESSDNVIYLGTISKTLSPTLRIGYLVVPAGLRSLFAAAKQIMDRHTPLFEQEALAAMLESGAYDSHVRRARRRNAERREALITALHRRFGDRIRIEGAAAGLHLVAWFDDLPQKREEALVKAARAEGVGIYPVSPLFAGPRAARKTIGLVMGYSALEVAQIERGCKLLAQAVTELD